GFNGAVVLGLVLPGGAAEGLDDLRPLVHGVQPERFAECLVGDHVACRSGGEDLVNGPPPGLVSERLERCPLSHSACLPVVPCLATARQAEPGVAQHCLAST